jgi:hypothetical protein
VRTSGGPSLDDGRRGLCPAGVVVPREGSLLLPFDAEWRQVSGYTEPEDYAPHIATRLVRNIREHVRAHEPSQHDDRDLPARAEQHAMLLEVLGREGQVEQQAPNRYVVRRGEGDDLTVLVTPDQWEQVIRRHGLRRASLLEHFDELLASPPGRSASSSTGRVTSRPRRGRCCLPPRGRSRRYARPGAGWPRRGRAVGTSGGSLPRPRPTTEHAHGRGAARNASARLRGPSKHTRQEGAVRGLRFEHLFDRLGHAHRQPRTSAAPSGR